MSENDNKKRIGSNNYYAGGAGVLRIPGVNSRSSDRYRERVIREGENFPNRRRRIITGKDLTTPLRRAKLKEIHKKVEFKIKTVKVKSESLPLASIFKIIAVSFAAFVLICSNIVLFNNSAKLNQAETELYNERNKMIILERELDLKNDTAVLLKMAREDYGMIEQSFISKYYLKTRREDKIVVYEENTEILPRMLSAFFSTDDSE